MLSAIQRGDLAVWAALDTLRTVEVADRLGTKHLGLLPDMGIFMKHYPPEFRDRFVRQGARPEIAHFIIDQHEQKIMAEDTIYEVAVKMRGNKAETVRIAKGIMGTNEATAGAIYDELMPMFSGTGKFEPKALAVLSRSFVEMKTLPSEPDMSKLYTEQFLPEN